MVMSDLINYSVIPIDLDDYDEIVEYDNDAHFVYEDDDCY